MHYFGGWMESWTPTASVGPLFIIIMVWSLIWKGFALWHSARRDDRVWFIILMFINTAGILEIIYLFAIAKLKGSELWPRKGSKHHQ